MDAQISFDKPLVPIAEIVSRPDFPHSAVGEFVDIAGFTGVIVEVIQNSIKIASPEGFTRRFNHHRLRELYGPRPDPDPIREPAPEPAAEQPTAQPTEIQDLNFDREARPIRDYFDRPHYPQCLVGELVDVGGYVGVVVSVESDSIKVRSRQGTSRKYNAAILPRLHGSTSPG